jgi:Flp pilus assembly pilin Flp
MLYRFWFDDAGQDLIEYALLSAFIGVCCVIVWQNIEDTIAMVYAARDAGIQDLSSCTPDPGGGGCPTP